jgi:Methyltransferase domain
MLRLFRPQRVIEVGSGFSSALMLDVNDRFLKGQMFFTFIEPYADRLEAILKPEDRSSVRMIMKPVQEVALEEFKSLRSGDLLFIDSSHISKTASDVNYLFLEVIPNLAAGVLVHLHDILWPFEYPAEWIRAGCAWNESYLVRAFLIFNESFQIVFWVPFAARAWPDIITERMPAYMINTGAALWLRRKDDVIQHSGSRACSSPRIQIFGMFSPALGLDKSRMRQVLYNTLL